MKAINNKFNCNKALWNKMTEAQKKVYNSIRSYKQAFIDPLNHSTKDGWMTISHNFAYLASQEIKY